MPVYLSTLGLQYYRGIASMQIMPEFKTFNFFIGGNNTGKSTILNFISKYIPPPEAWPGAAANPTTIDPLEVHSGHHGPISMMLGFKTDFVFNTVLERYPNVSRDHDSKENLQRIMNAVSNNGSIWLKGDLPYRSRLEMVSPALDSLAPLLGRPYWSRLWNQLTGYGQGDLMAHWIPGVLETVRIAIEMPRVRTSLIPAIRQIGPKGTAFDDFSGAGLIDRLAAIQNPEHDRRNDREAFDRINGFLRFVTGQEEATIEIPYSREHILVHMHERVLPLASLGTGIQEVVMIAAFCTLATGQIVCIEEPELHLHPLLQRKLIKYLKENTTNQYFIATHSPAFIDTPDAPIFHVYLQNNTTVIREAILRKDRFAICLDLGHRASDIIQSNAVIWVEGPSDRTYIAHWLRILAPEIVESIHYSIMFYGGRLLNHLSANDEEVSEFIQLRALNRHIAVVIDSDKATPSSRINETKKRLVEEFRDHGGVAWVTKGREIENYIAPVRLQRAVKEVYSAAYRAPLASYSAFDHSLYFERVNPKRRRRGGGVATPEMVEKDVDKVKVSKAVINDGTDEENELSVLDLRDRIEELVTMIRRANL